ncbi:MAG: molybdenum cofactor biosynthesis protein [Armatimonadetes bacterium CG2_30_59_28]|nr:MogA/MoaB family molybdenum cofactor biosynthesis protein [Armatimonadota bacterium]OIO96341.1 MAG: molybdenum cofactor biosynthesis protein [Armatimonadetes bacterium CG2_30_59_28]PIU63212.1 MAG: molybdenum cofactor biosynthesis protein [Armatimonadetes bacterium CG07_land_8_20_14_0_80_59_28]PIX41798.1 MAG: molybdenum cofactor biosynthesis protein [Armatimonadetes bacterium CG_4_8_14_3_um_filter_58_9]PIY40260.1 MAG: molybdenum cofactor biosynthesis protein [Armatimonadetes bacterium CG_4_10
MLFSTDQLHKQDAPKSVSVHVITVSDTRSAETDTSGRFIRNLLENNGHKVASYYIVRDDPEQIAQLLGDLLGRADGDAVILNGGTGISRRDRTYEVVSQVLEKIIDGFGEIFRFLSFQEVGSAAIMSRAVAGVSRDKVVISVPGSENAVRLAMNRLIIPELTHMVGTIRK